jgi:preprotein translocase subunit SecA
VRGPLEFSISFIEALSSRRVRRCLRRIERESAEFDALSDEALLLLCGEMVFAPKAPEEKRRQGSLLDMRGNSVGDKDARAIAIAAEVFSRFPPAGVEPGSRLYPEQVLAVVHLLCGALVQMDTGEGKTFAMSTAALALLRIHPRVYVITANPYLAARDAANTGPMWARLGIDYGYALENSEDARDVWRSRIVYTTLEAFTFHALTEELNGRGKFKWSAVLIDEADAVLLDEASRPHHIIRTFEDSEQSWSEQLRAARELNEEDVTVTEGASPWTRLTSTGEARALTLAAASEQMREVERLSFLHQVELAYTALRVVRAGHHYDVRQGQLIAMEPQSGWHKPNVTHPWFGPLAESMGLAPPPRTKPIAFASPISYLRQFGHLAGASGTILNEAIEYALLLAIPPALVRPRIPRQDGVKPDRIVASRGDAFDLIEEEVAKHGPKQPILIATDSTDVSSELALRLSRSIDVADVEVRLATDETIAAGPLFETAGKPGITVVSTRAAGRGVDIRLSADARKNGGALLLALGHSLEARLDRQLLGRVGREGDPFRAEFINHPDDTLMRLGSPAVLHKILDNLGPDGGIHAPVFNRLLASMQRARRRGQILRFATGISEAETRGSSEELIRGWRAALGAPASRCSDEFVEFLARRCILTSFPALEYQSHSEMTLVQAVAAEVTALIGGGDEEAQRMALATLHKPGEEAREYFVARLAEAMSQAREANAEACAKFAARTRAARSAALRARTLHMARFFAESSPEQIRSPEHQLQAALAASADSAHVSLGDFEGELFLGRLGESVSQFSAGEDHSAQALISALASSQGITVDAGPTEVIAEINTQLEELVTDYDRFDRRWEDWSKRTTWAVAYEALNRAAGDLSLGLDRIVFQVNQTVPLARIPAELARRVPDLNTEVEAVLARSLCADLIAGADPTGLDPRFAEAENRIEIHQPTVKLNLPTLPRAESPVPHHARPPASTRWDSLLTEFVDAIEERDDGDDFDRETHLAALRDVLDGVGLSALKDPDRVSEAYAGWRRSETRLRMAPWHWRAADRFVRNFLLFLNERGLAAPLPQGMQQRTSSLIRRVGRRVRAPAFTLALGSLVLAALPVIALGLLPALGPGFAVGVGPQFLAELLSGGTILSGSALGPLLFALGAGLWGRLLFGGRTASAAGLAQWERTVSLAALAILSLLATQPWRAGSAIELSGALLLWVGVFVLGLIARNGFYQFEQVSSYRLVAALFAGFSLVATIPFLASLGGSARVWSTVALCIALFWLTIPLRGDRLRTRALNVSSRAEEEREGIAVSMRVEGRLSLLPHAFALAFSWVLSCIFIEGDHPLPRLLLGGIAYLAVLMLWAHRRAITLTDPIKWRSSLRELDRAYEAKRPGTTLEKALTRSRQRIFISEIVVASLALTSATALGFGLDDHILAQIPLPSAIVFTSIVALDLALVSIRSLVGQAFSPTQDTADLSVEEFSVFAADVSAALRRYARRFGTLMVVLLALREVSDLLSVGELVGELVGWLEQLL